MPAAVQITPDTSAQAIIENMIATLEGIQLNGKAAFAAVKVVPTAGDFLESTDPLIDTGKGVVCGIVSGNPARKYGTDNAMDYVAKLEVPVIIQAMQQGLGLNFDMRKAIERMNCLADAVQQGVRVDPYRGGSAETVVYGGDFIDGTRIDGEVRRLASKRRSSVIAFLIPVVCGFTRNFANQ